MDEDTFPDIGSMSDQELKELIENRPEGETLIRGDDVQRLSPILAGRGESPTKPPT